MAYRSKYQVYVGSPFGPFTVWGDDEAVVGASFADALEEDTPGLPAHMVAAKQQARAYFEGTLTTFDLPIRFKGSEFQRSVWGALQRIPFGETRSYGQIAKAIGSPGAARAVGGACRSNPVGVIVPCHRVIGSSGDLVGFGGQTEDLSLKRGLIEHESAQLTHRLDEFEG